MIIDRIKLKNFGLYAGTQEVSLAPSKGKPITLIGGLNGGGKTTFLDALQLCLFGGQAKTSNRTGLSYQEYLSRCIYRGNDANQSSIEMNFNHTTEGTSDNYNLKRSWTRNGKVCAEKFEVSKNGKLEPFLSENWATQVDEFFPANIANLFLFDGEQIEAYASLEDSPVLIRSAIQNLLGLDLVDQLENDLHTFEKRLHQKEDVDESHMKIRFAQDDKEALETEIGSLQDQQKFIKGELKNAEASFSKAEQRYKKIGGELYERSEEIKQSLIDAKQALENGKQKLVELASGSMPLVLVRNLLIDSKELDESEEEAKKAQQLLDCLNERDETVLDEFSAYMNEDNLKKADKFLKKDRKKWASKGKLTPQLNLNQSERDNINHLLNFELTDIKETLTNLLNQQETLKQSTELAQNELDSIPKHESIASLADECSTLSNKIEKFQVNLSYIELELEHRNRDLARREQHLIRLIESDSTVKNTKDDQSRMLHHSAKARLTLSKFRTSIIAKHVHKIENLVYECYRRLLRKNALITRIAIDPSSYMLTLYDRNSNEFSSDRLSAGERQLLSIALLWGLAKASGRPLPTAIDTPLGRLDSAHRMNLIENYLPYASHQVLLLSTDEEITGEYLDSLAPWIGRKYHLQYDDKAGKTTIAEGYFS